MVNSVCDGAELYSETVSIAQKIASNAPRAVRAVKEAARETEGLYLGDALELELEYYNGLLNTRDRHEGINAFNEKRKPAFTGE
jgi:enoyl-CoA hydratase/carnithine racemase